MKIKVQAHGETLEWMVPGGARLLEYLNAHQVHVNSSCAGKGTCQKCRVKIVNGFAAPTQSDRQAFTESELQEGWRLSCQTLPRTNIEVLVPDIENPRARPQVIRRGEGEIQNPVMICDLGSTGIVVALAEKAPVEFKFDLGGAQEFHSEWPSGSGSLARSDLLGPTIESELPNAIEVHAVNRQIKFGADVMTRLASAQKLGVTELKKALDDTLRVAIEVLVEQTGFSHLDLKQKMFCSGNSAMVSFLNNWSIEQLAVSPFQPEKLTNGEAQLTWSKKLADHSLFSKMQGDGLPLETLPLLGGFVGADTVAGILWLEACGAPAPWMLVDIGTNTELVLKTAAGEYWVTSAPAGPAFEGGNISSGMRASPGAIATAQLVGESWSVTTIGQDRPRGICGSGLMDVIYEGLGAGLIHPDGLVPARKISITPEISLVADDIREFQLAKSATRTAADLLIGRAGEVPQKIYLAGTFAQHLSLKSVAGLGLLPQGITVQQVGNSSLKGTWIYASMTEDAQKAWCAGLQRRKHHVELALQDDFQDAFVKNLNLGP